MKRNFPIWQITLPLSGILIFAIGSITAVNMINGRYLFHIEASPKKLLITTDMDKRGSDPAENTTKQEKIQTPR